MTDTSTTKKREGWGFPSNSRKAHWFAERSTSLCSKWMFFGTLEPDDYKSEHDCKDCRRRLTKRQEQAAKEQPYGQP